MNGTASSIITIACLLFTGGCAGVWPEAAGQQQRDRQAHSTAQQKIADAHRLAQASQYSEALAMYRLVLKEHVDSEWAPEAKYGIALLLAAADNPQRDYSAAMAEFDEFLSVFPADRRAAEAKSWRQALKVLQDTKKENDRLRKNLEKLKQLDVQQEEKRLGR